ncbi:chemotaxis protein CheW [Ramlibacter alkalitolerans]|uniref:Chemotaxis protein CheA n=2 Tax=Ramlibacter alkalitolerans TaxID=2039631 RepID=A0ABS1JKY8_9BURK|nr:chemotaxis protein CheW [Ramlibacter alkalitolerans]
MGPGDLHQAFHDEAEDNLRRLEQLLLALDPAAPQDETLHAIFRCAHSVKGGAAAFGFGEVASLTHAMETLLDQLRRHEQRVSAAMVDTLLEAGDLLRAMLAHRRDAADAPPDAAPLLARLAALASQGAHPAGLQPGAGSPGRGEARELEVLAGPLPDAAMAQDLLELFREVSGAGELQPADALPGQPATTARFRLRTGATDDEVLDLCSFHVPRECLRLAPWPEAGPAPAQATSEAAAAPPAPPTHPVPHRASAAGETLRVAVAKIDQLINLVGELVINQAMLAERAARIDAGERQHLEGGLGDLERTTRQLQDSVMAIRMVPMGEVFQRFPRMLRDLGARLGKQVELHTAGEATELDKGMIEKITDPLTHLVRNAVDHGIEPPQQRVAAGKPAHGTLTLAARHEGGCVVIEVRDDGRGLDRSRILEKGRAAGLPLPEAASDDQVWQLIFAPGLSTAETVSDVSGRGVGMDVVRRNIEALGGSVELHSEAGRGTCVRVRLPLTLAIMDGITVSLGEELYVLPLASVVESFQARPGAVKSVAESLRVVQVRNEYLPVVPLADVVGLECAPAATPMLVLVQADERRIALEVGALVGQQQVVVKNLETHYRRIAGISGATIMGDGRVALILDAAALVRGAHQAASSSAVTRRQDGQGSATGATRAAFAG